MANVLGPDMDPAGETHIGGGTDSHPTLQLLPSSECVSVGSSSSSAGLFLIFLFFHPSSCRPSLYVIHEKLALHWTYLSKSTRLHSSLAWDKALMCLPALILMGSEVHEMISKEWSGRTKYLALHHIPHKYLSFFGFHFSRAGWRTDASRQTNVSGVAVWTLRAELMSGRLMFGSSLQCCLSKTIIFCLYEVFSGSQAWHHKVWSAFSV